MKTLKVNDVTYEIVDEAGRGRITSLEDRATSIEKTEKELTQKVNIVSINTSNSIKKTVSGYGVTMNDVSPVEHELVVNINCPEGVDPTTVKVRRRGKNLLPLKTFTVTPTSTIVTVKDDILTIEGYLASHRVPAFGLIGKKLTLSCTSKRDGEKGGGLAIECRDASNTKISGVFKQNELSPSFSFTVPENTDRIVVFFYASGSAEEHGTAEYRNILLEVGESVTDYEPYKEETEHTPSSDGAISGITSLSPSMTILTDTEDVTIECEYNRDTNKVIESLIKAIEDLGGTV